MQIPKIALLGLAACLPHSLAILTEGSWSITAYSENDCGGDQIGTMGGNFTSSDDRTSSNGCLATTDGRVANSFYIDFEGTNGNGNGNTYVVGEGFSACSGPGTYYDGANPGLDRNSCQYTSASGCVGISKFQQNIILYSADDSTCLGIA